jgi:hypothetical protein
MEGRRGEHTINYICQLDAIGEEQMVKAELIHNPYLLETAVRFNGREPKINSLVEKYRADRLQDWIAKLPAIFYNQMNGYDFDLDFSGTKTDFGYLHAVGLVGGMVGYAVATGAYATAIEAAAGGADALADKAAAAASGAADAYSTVSAAVAEGVAAVADTANQAVAGAADTYSTVSAAVAENVEILQDKAVELGQSVVDLVQSTVPDAAGDVRAAMNSFAASLGVPIHL